MAPVLVTLNDLECHFPVAGLFKCNPSNICAVFYQISTDSALARSLSDSWASCLHQWSCTIKEEGLSQEKCLRLALWLRCGFWQITLTSCSTSHTASTSVLGDISHLARMLIYSSNETRSPNANLPTCAHLGGILYQSPMLHPGTCSSVGMRRGQTGTHRDRQPWAITIHFVWIFQMGNAIMGRI